MIAPQVGPGAFLLLLSPDHIGTGVPLLLTSWCSTARHAACGCHRWWG